MQLDVDTYVRRPLADSRHSPRSHLLRTNTLIRIAHKITFQLTAPTLKSNGHDDNHDISLSTKSAQLTIPFLLCILFSVHLCIEASFLSFFSHFCFRFHSSIGLVCTTCVWHCHTNWQSHTLNLSKFVPFSQNRRVSTTLTLSINDYMKTTTRVKFVCHIYATSQFTKTRKYIIY